MKTTYAKLVDSISNVRYGDLGKVLFDCNGKTYTIAEPTDVLLVGYGERSARWIALNYGFLIA